MSPANRRIGMGVAVLLALCATRLDVQVRAQQIDGGPAVDPLPVGALLYHGYAFAVDGSPMN